MTYSPPLKVGCMLWPSTLKFWTLIWMTKNTSKARTTASRNSRTMWDIYPPVDGDDGVVQQGNRVLTKEHLEEVVLDPTCFKPFTLDTPFEGGFLLQHIEGNLA